MEKYSNSKPEATGIVEKNNNKMIGWKLKTQVYLPWGKNPNIFSAGKRL